MPSLHIDLEPGRAQIGFYEKVWIRTRDPAWASVNGQLGVVLGKRREKLGKWLYAVLVYRDTQRCVLWESELRGTGSFDSIERLYDLCRRTVRP